MENQRYKQALSDKNAIIWLLTDEVTIMQGSKRN